MTVFRRYIFSTASHIIPVAAHALFKCVQTYILGHRTSLSNEANNFYKKTCRVGIMRYESMSVNICVKL